MINNAEQIVEYEGKNKIYIPEDYVQNNWKYTLDNETVTIITNNNCTQNYNTTYCDCKKYNLKYNIIMETYSCNANPTQNIINRQYISTDVNDSIKITNDYIKDYGLIFAMIIAIILFVSLFKKNSRNI